MLTDDLQDRHPTHPSHLHNSNSNSDAIPSPKANPILASYAQPGLFSGSDMPSVSSFFPSIASINAMDIANYPHTLSTNEWIMHGVGISAGVFVVYCFARFVRRRMGWIAGRQGEYEIVVGKW
jgi:hypothetical protein